MVFAAAPDLIRAEVGDIAWKLHLRGVLDTNEASNMIEHFPALPVEIHDSVRLLGSALEIAMATKRPVYDSLYLALAVELGGVVVTADERWAHALRDSPFGRFLELLD